MVRMPTKIAGCRIWGWRWSLGIVPRCYGQQKINHYVQKLIIWWFFLFLQAMLRLYWLKLYSITLYVLFFQREHKHIFTFYVILPHQWDPGSWNSSLSKTGTCLFYIINIMAADVLATQEARASVTMIMTQLNRVNSVPRTLRVKSMLYPISVGELASCQIRSGF